MASMPHWLIADFHGRLLRRLSAHANVHFQGLHQAARHFRRGGALGAAMLRKLAHVDIAFNYVRHVTAVSVEEYLRDLEVAFAGAGNHLDGLVAVRASPVAAPGPASPLPPAPQVPHFFVGSSASSTAPDLIDVCDADIDTDERMETSPSTWCVLCDSANGDCLNGSDDDHDIIKQASSCADDCGSILGDVASMGSIQNVAPGDAFSQTPISSYNMVIIDEPSMLVHAAVNNALCRLALHASSRSIDTQASLAVAHVATPAAPCDDRSEHSAKLVTDPGVPLLNDWTAPVIAGQCAATAAAAASLSAFAAARPAPLAPWAPPQARSLVAVACDIIQLLPALRDRSHAHAQLLDEHISSLWELYDVCDE